MKSLFVVLQIIVSLLLVGAITLQTKGQGLSTSFGGKGEFYSSKRGVEKVFFWATVVLVCLFALVSLINLVI